MKHLHVHVGVLLLAGLTAGAGCSSHAQSTSDSCGNFSSLFSLADASGQTVGSYSFFAGDPITLFMQITNNSADPQSVEFITTCTVVFNVTNAAGALVYYGPQQACGQVAGPETFAGGVNLAFAAQWTQALSDGSPAPAGQYTVNATTNFCNATLAKSVNFSIQ